MGNKPFLAVFEIECGIKIEGLLYGAKRKYCCRGGPGTLKFRAVEDGVLETEKSVTVSVR